MVFSSKGEFDVQFADLLMKVDRACDENSRDTALSASRRTLALLSDRFKRNEKIRPLDRQQLANALVTVQKAIGHDAALEDRIFDIEDYIDMHFMADTK